MNLIKNITALATIVIILLASVSATSKNDADATNTSRLRARTSTIKSSKSIMAPRSVAHPRQVTTTQLVGHHPSDGLETKPDDTASKTTPPAAGIKAEDEQRYLRGDDTSASEISPSSPTAIMSNDEVARAICQTL
jgi:hypothetical protein